MSIHQRYEHIRENFFKPFIGEYEDLFRNDIVIRHVNVNCFVASSLRKVKLDQRKLTDNVNAVSDIARVRQYERSS
jgi:hypothetical protein